jgi:hypothetical protein
MFASLLAIWVSPAFGQIVVTSRPVVTYYTPAAPAVTYSPAVTSTVVSSPVVEYAAPVTVSRPVTTYYAPAVTAAPVTTYYAPASYVVPTTSYYAPVTTYYGGPVVTPVYGRPVTVGRSLYGTLTPYVPGQPVRNTLRFALP